MNPTVLKKYVVDGHEVECPIKVSDFEEPTKVIDEDMGDQINVKKFEYAAKKHNEFNLFRSANKNHTTMNPTVLKKYVVDGHEVELINNPKTNGRVGLQAKVNGVKFTCYKTKGDRMTFRCIYYFISCHNSLRRIHWRSGMDVSRRSRQGWGPQS